jgi:hypothetical protein
VNGRSVHPAINPRPTPLGHDNDPKLRIFLAKEQQSNRAHSSTRFKSMIRFSKIELPQRRITKMNKPMRIKVIDEIESLTNWQESRIRFLELENDKLRRELNEIKDKQLQRMLVNLRSGIAA